VKDEHNIAEREHDDVVTDLENGHKRDLDELSLAKDCIHQKALNFGERLNEVSIQIQEQESEIRRLKADLDREKALHAKTKLELEKKIKLEEDAMVKKAKEESYALGRKD
jgi:hypothetical protein